MIYFVSVITLFKGILPGDYYNYILIDYNCLWFVFIEDTGSVNLYKQEARTDICRGITEPVNKI
jgi:hypothetical protein